MVSRKVVRVGVAGCGGVTPWTLEQLALHLDLLQVCAVQDPDENARESVGGRFGIPVRHARFVDLCAAGLDLVVLNSPNDQHREQVEVAVAHGIACLVQKPMAPDAADAFSMVSAAERAGVALGVVKHERSDPLHHELRRLLRAGFIGEPVLFESVLAHDRYLRAPPPEGDWRRDPERVGGGAFAQLAVHAIDLVSWLTGRICAEVVALGARGHTVFSHESEAAVLRFSDAMLATISASWAANGQRWALRGTKGEIEVDAAHVRVRGAFAFREPLLTYSQPGTELVVPRSALAAAARQLAPACEVHGAFARHVRGDEQNPSPAVDGVRDLLVLAACRRAARDGRAVPVPQVAD